MLQLTPKWEKESWIHFSTSCLLLIWCLVPPPCQIVWAAKLLPGLGDLWLEVPLALLLLLQGCPCPSSPGPGEQETKVPNELVKHLYNFSSFYKEGLLYTIYTWRWTWKTKLGESIETHTSALARQRFSQQQLDVDKGRQPFYNSRRKGEKTKGPEKTLWAGNEGWIIQGAPIADARRSFMDSPPWKKWLFSPTKCF